MLGGIADRGFRFNEAILVVMNGSKGIHKTVKETSGQFRIMAKSQRYQ